MKRAVITGGSGFVGRRLTARLIGRGTGVVWISRRDPKESGIPEGATWRFGDLDDPPTLRGCIAPGDHVFHLAAVLGAARASRKTYQAANVLGTAHILQEAVGNGAAHFQFLSSFAAMGPVGSPSAPMTEETPPRPNSLYGRSKWEAERQIHQLAEGKIPCTILRPPIIYGPGANPVSAAARLFGLASRENPVIIGSGENTFPVCHVDNLISAMVHTISVATGGVDTYLVADDPPSSLNEFLNTLGAPGGREIRPLHFPASLAWAVAALLEAIARPLGRSPALSTEVVGGLTRSDAHYDLSRLKGTGWLPEVTMAEGAAAWADQEAAHAALAPVDSTRPPPLQGGGSAT